MRIITVDENGYLIDVDEKEKEMRLIDADKLINDIQYNLWDWKSVDGITATTVLKQTITDIKNEPTIHVVPAVRCDKCRHHYERGRDIVCAIINDVVMSNSYCSYWEKKR